MMVNGISEQNSIGGDSQRVRITRNDTSASSIHYHPMNQPEFTIRGGQVPDATPVTASPFATPSPVSNASLPVNLKEDLSPERRQMYMCPVSKHDDNQQQLAQMQAEVRLAEHTKNYEASIQAIKQLLSITPVLTTKQRNLLSSSYTALVNQRRSSLRCLEVLLSVLQTASRVYELVKDMNIKDEEIACVATTAVQMTSFGVDFIDAAVKVANDFNSGGMPRVGNEFARLKMNKPITHLPVNESYNEFICRKEILCQAEYYRKRMVGLGKTISLEMERWCEDMIGFTQRKILPGVESFADRIFYIQLIGDMGRYAAQVASKQEKQERFRGVSLKAYETALDLLEKGDAPEALLSVKLGVILNYAVLLRDNPDDINRAIDVLAKAFQDAVENVVSIEDAEESRNVMQILSLIRDNVETWCNAIGRDDAQRVLGLGELIESDVDDELIRLRTALSRRSHS